MKEQIETSVIIPVFNGEKYISKSIESILNQTYKHFELIVVDDGSTDNTKNIILNYAKQDNRIKYIHKHNGGVSSARNVGLNSSCGEFIGFLDADDDMISDALEFMVKTIKDENADLFIGRTYIKDSKGAEKKFGLLTDCDADAKKPLSVLKLANAGILSDVYDKLFRKKLLFDVRFDESISFGEDRLFVVDYLKNCGKIVFRDKHIINYNVFANPNSLMNIAHKDLSRNTFVLTQKLLSHIKTIYPNCKILYFPFCLPLYNSLINLVKAQKRQNASEEEIYSKVEKYINEPVYKEVMNGMIPYDNNTALLKEILCSNDVNKILELMYEIIETFY